MLIACSLPVLCGVPAALRGSGWGAGAGRGTSSQAVCCSSRLPACSAARLGSGGKDSGPSGPAPLRAPGALSPCRAGSGGSRANSVPPRRAGGRRGAAFSRGGGSRALRDRGARAAPHGAARRAPGRRALPCPAPRGQGEGSAPGVSSLHGAEGRSGGGMGA